MLEIKTVSGLLLQIPQFKSVKITTTGEEVTDISNLMLSDQLAYVFVGDETISIKGSDILFLRFI